MHTRHSAVLAVVAVLALPAGAGAAGSVSTDGTTIRVTEAAPGEENSVTVAMQQQGVVEVSDFGTVVAGAGCAPKETAPETATCPLGSGGVEVVLGGGDDTFGTYFETGLTPLADGALRVDLGDGDDTAHDSGLGDRVQGGAGADTLEGGLGSDILDGGPGNDTLSGGEGADDLRGQDGDDHLEADPFSDRGVFADVVDGGAGVDELVDYRSGSGESEAPPVDISLDGAANDGRAGERDNVLAIERIESSSAGTFTGDDGANVFVAPEVGRASRMAGAGGDDRLFAGDASGDAVEGGPGDDELSGGFGDDTLTGGPGRDLIAADRPARCNEIHCDIGGGFGNDVVLARDGEVDSVVCGPGQDTVRADADDVVADDCETVDRGAASPRVQRVGLRRALRRGVTVRVTGATAGANVQGRLVRAGTTLASGAATAGADGRATVRLRFARPARRQLRRARSLVATLRVTGVPARRVAFRR